MTDSRSSSEPRSSIGVHRPSHHGLTWMLAVVVLALPAANSGPAAATAHSRRGADEQPASLVGEVRDARGPIAQANIVVRRAGRGSISDERGRFVVVGIPPGRWRVDVRIAGYETRRATIEFAAGRTETLAVVLAEADARQPVRTIEMRPGMVLEQPERMAQVGRPCVVHPGERLLADTVGVWSNIGGHLPGDAGPVRDSFPNANERARGGAMSHGLRAQTAYCRECRRALDRWLARDARDYAARQDSMRAK